MSTAGKDVAELLHTRPLSLISRVGEQGKGSFTTSSDESDPPATKMVRCSADLKTACESTIIKELGEIATGRCSCGGMLQSPPTVLLNFLGKSGQWIGTTFPGLGEEDFKQLLEASEVASFGRGAETITDTSIRDAFAMGTDKFTTSFQLSNTSLLQEIRMLLAPDAMSVRAEPYKLNIYTAPTGCFKAHVDTPRAGNMFGSLVVCLPSYFKGGALVTRHNGQEVTYNWSDNPVQKIQWAAFYSDVEHEILPVTEGYRVTLTYNLYHCKVPHVDLDVTVSPFYSNLKAALCHPHFMRRGGILGFACQHFYVFSELEKSPGNLSPLLKGSDRNVVLSAKSLSLKVQVKPEYDFRDNWNDGEVREIARCVDINEDSNEKSYIDECFPFKAEFVNETWSYSNYQTREPITWCHEILWQPAVITPRYGNDASLDILYQAAVILITIPGWSARQLKTEKADQDN